MRHTMRSISLFTSCAVLLGAAAYGQDWPQWMGPNRDGKASGFDAPQTWPKALNQKWKINVGPGDATPALVGDKLYAFGKQGNDEVLVCLNAADGKEIWRDKHAAAAINGADRGHAGPRSSPAVADGKVVTLGAGGVVSCLDAASGKLLWRKEATGGAPRFHVASSPLIADGLCIVQLGGSSAGTISAFDLATGNEKWKWAGDGPSYASPVLMTVEGTKQIVAQTQTSIVGVSAADGKLLWKIAAASGGMGAYNAVTPVIDGQTLIYTGQGSGTKAVKVTKQGDQFTTKELWGSPVGTKYNTPVLKDGLLFGYSQSNGLYCMRAATGEIAWKTGRGGQGFGTVVDAGPVLLALPTASSELIAYRATDTKYDELARIKVGDQPYAFPIVSGKRIFVKDAQNLTLWSLD